MTRAHAGTGANPVSILITDGAREHPASTWAAITTNGIVVISPDASPERTQQGVDLRKDVFKTLCEAFQAVKPTSSLDDIDRLNRTVLDRVGRIFAGTPWSANFEEPTIKGQICVFIHRNLLTAADLALKAE